MKRTIPILLCALLVATSSEAAGAWLKKVDEAQKVAKEKNQLIFVDLFAQWCGWCHRFDREIVPSEPFQNATRDMVLLRVDTEDRGEGTALSQRYNVRKLPSFLILAPDMAVASMIEGYAPPRDFAKRIEDGVARYEEYRKDVAASAKKGPEERLRVAREMVGRHDFAEAQKRVAALAAEKSAPAAARQEALYLSAMAHSGRGNNDEALKTVERLLSGKPTQEWAEKGQLLRAEVFLSKRDYPAALAEYRRFKASYPQSSHLQVVNYYIPQLESLIARNGK